MIYFVIINWYIKHTRCPIICANFETLIMNRNIVLVTIIQWHFYHTNTNFLLYQLAHFFFFNIYSKWPPSSRMHNLALVKILSATLCRVSVAKFSTITLFKAFTRWTVFLSVMVKLTMKTLRNWVHPSSE